MIYIIKTIWKFLTQDPKERTDEEREDIFIVARAMKETRENAERRKRGRRSIYAGRGIYSNKMRRRTGRK